MTNIFPTYHIEVCWDNLDHATDGDMEAANTAAYTATNCTLAKDAVTFFDGAKALKGTNTSANGYAQQAGSMAAGLVATVTVRAKGGDAGTKLQVYSTPSNTLLDEVANPDTTNWNELRVIATIPGSDTGYQVRLVHGSGAAAVAYWDELVIEQWTEEKTHFLSAKWRRGRDYASQLTGHASAGRCTLEMDNSDGRYSTLNTAGSLYPNVLPARKIRIRTSVPQEEILWQGYLATIEQSPRSRQDRPTALLSAYGPLSWLAEKKASTQVFTNILGGAAIHKILDDGGWPLRDRNIDTGQVTMARWKADGDLVISHLREIEETELGYIGESKDGKIVFEDNQHRLSPPFTTPQATFSDANGAALPYEMIKQEDPWREIYNIAEAEVVTYTVQSLAVLWSLSEVIAINASDTTDLWALYPNDGDASNAYAVDAWTTPVATTDYLANSQADGLGTNKTANVSITVDKFANAMKISITNNDAGTVYITFLQARGTPVYANDPIRVVVEDATSQAKFGERTYPLPGKFYPSTSVALSYGQLTVARYKDQLAVLSISFQANVSSSHMTQALTRDVSDRIALVAQGTLPSGAQLGINSEFFIEAEYHELSLNGHWVTYEVSDARFDTGFWLLGTGMLGTTTKLAA